ncbi:hypothetical protein FZ103_10545 [Streptomonospora sp. PA3]|uniref:hypothetical protein n=1 Tax=Streptomonospora sp. PA3 TaxID=2607326 RepID=UPI0012DCD5B7|nr:hypothetical protein [Streptomonospora sp. PA3]MUL41609.1 hypothetical protein [Streptomonospora sp. PA3]
MSTPAERQAVIQIARREWAEVEAAGRPDAGGHRDRAAQAAALEAAYSAFRVAAEISELLGGPGAHELTRGAAT